MDQKILEKLGKLGDDIAQLRNENKTEFAQVRSEFTELRKETKAEFAQVRSEFTELRKETKAEFAQIRQEVKAEFAQLREVDLPNVVAGIGEINGDIFDEIDKQKADREDVSFLTTKVNRIEKKLAS